MNLQVEIKPDFERTISITDYTLDFNEYIDEEITDLLPRYESFKYSHTCTINILIYHSTKGDYLVDTLYSQHDAVSESIRVRLPQDGYYHLYHIVLPTVEWLKSVKDLDLSYYNGIYVTDGYYIYKYFNDNIQKIDPLEVLEINPRNTTISIVMFKVFNIDGLKKCYASASRKILDNYVGKCSSISDIDKFNRDFLWMTINVISYYLEWNKYNDAQIVLEDLKCHNFCPDSIGPFKNEKVSCGCRN